MPPRSALEVELQFLIELTLTRGGERGSERSGWCTANVVGARTPWARVALSLLESDDYGKSGREPLPVRGLDRAVSFPRRVSE